MKRWFLAVVLVTWGGAELPGAEPTRSEAVAALKRAVEFFRGECSAGGGYIFRLSGDLSRREGEGKVGVSTAWLQPPGTPSVGQAYLDAYQHTGEEFLLAAAKEAALALVRGQLESGGWYHRIEFAPEDRRRFGYRVEEDHGGRQINETTFDDDKSQSAARFLMRLDKELDFSDPTIHEATLYALDAFVGAQYQNGAWPQRYAQPPGDVEIKRATFPEQWSRTFPGADYRGHYTLNDNTISDLVDTMLLAGDIYQNDRYLDAAKRAGDFLLLAQLPEPQPGWAQQYDAKMQPAWARKFEPPAVTGGEAQGVMKTLLKLAQRTGEAKYLTAVEPALNYYRRSLLPDGRLARFYEIGSNRPLYFTRDYKLTYSDSDMPTHYSFKVSSRLDRLQTEHARLSSGRAASADRPSQIITGQQARQLMDALDERGAWVQKGRMRYHGADDPTTETIESSTFCRRLVDLARYAERAN